MINLLKQASQYAIQPAYVLFDNWFTCPKTLLEILELKFHAIAIFKVMSRVYYNYNGKLLNLKCLYTDLKKRYGKAKILSSAIVGVGSDIEGKEVKAIIVL